MNIHIRHPERRTRPTTNATLWSTIAVFTKEGHTRLPAIVTAPEVILTVHPGCERSSLVLYLSNSTITDG